MKKILDTKNLPFLAVLLGGIAAMARLGLYLLGTDEKGLLVQGHPLSAVVTLLTAAVLVYLVMAVRKLDGSGEYGDNFGPDRGAMLGHMAFAVGIALTMLTRAPMMYGYLGKLWQLFGWLSPVCLAAAGLARLKGKMPFFLLHLVPCLFLVFHIINHYQSWSGNPQLQDYAFMLFGTMALMLFAFYSASFAVGSGSRRMHLFTGLAAMYLLMAELVTTQYLWLYLGGIFWVLTNLCSLTPVPKKEPESEPESGKES